mgnify:CR=1 FL=1
MFLNISQISFRLFHSFLLVMFLTITASISIAQNHEPAGQRWMVGWEPGFFYLKYKEPYPGTAKYDLLLLETYFDLGYFLNKKVLIGGQAGHSFKAFGNAMDFPDLYYLGWFVRYYPFEGYKAITMENIVCEQCATWRFRPYIQMKHILTNSQIKDGRNIGWDHLGIHEISAAAGTAIRLRRNLFFNIGTGLRYSLNSDKPFFMPTINSLEYFFGYSSKNENINRPDCNSTLLWGVLSCMKNNKRKEQPNNPKGVLVGSSFTYIFDNSRNGIVEGKFREYSWNINMVTFLPKRFRAGVNSIQISTQVPDGTKNNHFLVGGILQHEMPLTKNDFFLLETGLMTGNYCTCGAFDPVKNEGLMYLDLGAAFEFRIFPKTYLDLGFNVYQILNDVEGKYAYTQYVVGLNYLIGKR